MSEHTTTFEYEKATKNTFRFQETPPEGEAPIIGSLYIQKWFFNGDPPDGVEVTVKPR